MRERTEQTYGTAKQEAVTGISRKNYGNVIKHQ